jgi:putative GTP pyrophosphokinase
LTLEEYYGNKLPLLKQGEAYLKTLMETYPNSCNKDGLQAILYIKTRIKTPESMVEKLKRHGMKEDSHTALQQIHDALESG